MDSYGKILENPYTMTDYAWERGQKMWKVNCAICHGVKGVKYGPAVHKVDMQNLQSLMLRRRFKWSK